MSFRNLLLNILLAVGALALVAGVGIIALRMTQPSNGGDAEASLQKPAILVTTHAIKSGSLLRADDIAWRETEPSGITPGNLIRGRVTISDYSGAVVRHDLGAGAPLLASAIVKPNERGFLAAVLSPGDRAMTISISASQSASGLVLPGDYVDVILTQNFDSYTTDPARKSVGETVLRNVRVIAVDRRMSGGADTPQTSAAIGVPESTRTPKTITLEVSEEQAQRLMVATSLGHIDLALRALQTANVSVNEETSQPVWADDVSPALRDLTQGRRATATPVHTGRSAVPVAPVRILRGSKVETQ